MKFLWIKNVNQCKTWYRNTKLNESQYLLESVFMNFPSSLLRSFIEISILSAALSYCVKVKIITRRNHRRCFVKEGVLKKFANFTKKTPVLESLVHKVAGLKACNFIKKRPQHMSSLVKFVNFLRTPVVKDIRERLLLH